MNKHFTFVTIIVLVSFGFLLGLSSGDGRKIPRDPNANFDNPQVVKGPVLDNPSSTLNESFEGVTFPPAGWTKLNPDGGTGWVRQPAGVSPIPGWNGGTTSVPTGGGTAAAYCTWNTGGASSNDQWLVSPQITNVQPNDSLSFWLLKPGYTSASYLDSIDVLISTTTPTVGAFTTVVQKIVIPAASNDTLWKKYSYRLGDYVSAGSNIYIAWREHVADNFNDGAAFLLDLVSVTEGGSPPSVCNLFAGSWAPANTYPPTPSGSGHSAAAWLADTLYTSLTTNGVPTTTIMRYTWGGSWSTGVSLPVARGGGSLTKCGNKLYYIGGGETSVTIGTNSTYEYDPGTGAWTQKANLPASLSGHSAVSWGDSVVIVIGGPWGATGSSNLDVHYYRPGSNTWGTISNSLPSGAGRRTFALGLVDGNKIVMSCGYNGAFLNSTYIGTLGTNASQINWTAGPNAPAPGTSRPGGTSYGDFFFVIGGEISGQPRSTNTYVYSGSGNAWVDTISNLPPSGLSNMYNSVAAKCINDTVSLFMIGGYDGAAYVDNFNVTRGGLLTSLDPVSNIVPEKFSLSQNYPNPFNPNTKIKFEIPKQSFVVLKVYDITGREVANLVSGIRSAGIYETEFDGSKLSSGTYFYRIEVDDFVQIKKMVLIK